jgi:hypothetical protein
VWRRISERRSLKVSDVAFLNTYHNASTPLSAEVPADLAGFMLAADAILAQAAELARIVTQAHQSAAAHLIAERWQYARKYFSLSEKYAAWADYNEPAAALTSTALDALAQVHLPKYREKLAHQH